jgi:hypothetical protein
MPSLERLANRRPQTTRDGVRAQSVYSFPDRLSAAQLWFKADIPNPTLCERQAPHHCSGKRQSMDPHQSNLLAVETTWRPSDESALQPVP